VGALGRVGALDLLGMCGPLGRLGPLGPLGSPVQLGPLRMMAPLGALDRRGGVSPTRAVILLGVLGLVLRGVPRLVLHGALGLARRRGGLGRAQGAILLGGVTRMALLGGAVPVLVRPGRPDRVPILSTPDPRTGPTCPRDGRPMSSSRNASGRWAPTRTAPRYRVQIPAAWILLGTGGPRLACSGPACPMLTSTVPLGPGMGSGRSAGAVPPCMVLSPTARTCPDMGRRRLTRSALA